MPSIGASSASNASSSSSEPKLPHDFPEVPPEDDPEGVWAGAAREEAPGPPPPPVQLRLVLEVFNPVPVEEGGGKDGGGEESGNGENGSKNLVFGAAVSAALALGHVPLAQVRGGAGRVTLESSSSASNSRSRAPVLGVAPEQPLSLAGSKEVECVFVGGQSKKENDSDPSSPSNRLRGSKLSPDSLVVEPGDHRHELELIPRAGFRDAGVRAPRPKPRPRVPGVARSLSEADSAYAAALAAGSAFARYPRDGGVRRQREAAAAEKGKETDNNNDDDDDDEGEGGGAAAEANNKSSPSSSPSSSSSSSSSSFPVADFDNSGGARTLLERTFAVGLIGEIARPVTLEPGRTFVGEAVLRIHDLSFDPGAEADFRWRRTVAARPVVAAAAAAGTGGGGEQWSGEIPERSASDQDVTVVDNGA